MGSYGLFTVIYASAKKLNAFKSEENEIGTASQRKKIAYFSLHIIAG